MAMTIEELKKALVEVSELCEEMCCRKCPLHFEAIDKFPECPLCDDSMTCPPAYWAKSKLMKEGTK